MDDDAVWSLEKRFWTGGEGHDPAALDAACVMAFPAPVGILAGDAVVQSLDPALRWSSVVMDERRFARPCPEPDVLGYRARGHRDGTGAYEASCTSTHRSAGGGGAPRPTPANAHRVTARA